MTENEISAFLVNNFLKIHRQLGPGLLGSVYEEVICYELQRAGIAFKRQLGMMVMYDGIKMDLGFRADVIVDDKVIIEIKSVDILAPVHHKQLLTYLRFADMKIRFAREF